MRVLVRILGDLSLEIASPAEARRMLELKVPSDGHRVSAAVDRTRLSLDLEGSLSRSDFGLRWNQVIDAGPIAGDEIRLSASLSLIRRSE